jgi:hypothetical protein
MAVWLEFFGYSILNIRQYCGANKEYLFLSLLVCVFVCVCVCVCVCLVITDLQELKQPTIKRYYFLKEC